MPETVSSRPMLRLAHPTALNVRYETNPDGWVTAQLVEFPAVISQGANRSEAFGNLIDAAYDFAHEPSGAERAALWVQARVIEPLGRVVALVAGRF